MAEHLNEPARDGRDETRAAELDRNYTELLQELRISETGVQVLFAFLLAIPFQQRFASIAPFDKCVYVVTLVLCTMAVALLVAPVAFHRLVFRRGMKGELVKMASRLAIAGTTFLLLAVLSGVLLVLDFAVGRGFAITVTALLSLVFLSLWVVLPLVRRHRMPIRR